MLCAQVSGIARGQTLQVDKKKRKAVSPSKGVYLNIQQRIFAVILLEAKFTDAGALKL